MLIKLTVWVSHCQVCGTNSKGQESGQSLLCKVRKAAIDFTVKDAIGYFVVNE